MAMREKISIPFSIGLVQLLQLVHTAVAEVWWREVVDLVSFVFLTAAMS